MTRRVLMLLENDTYPEDTRVVKEARALVDAGYVVSVWCPGLPEQPSAENIDGVDVRRYRAHFATGGMVSLVREYAWSGAQLGLGTIRSLFRPGFDVVHVHNPPDFLAAIALPCRLLGKKIVYDNHDLSPELFEAKFGQSKPLGLLARVLESISCRAAHVVLTDGESSRRVLSRRHSLQEDEIKVVGNGPSVSRLADLSLLPGHPGEKIEIAFLGYLDKQDGLASLLEVVQILANEMGRTDFHCRIIGDGESLSELRSDAHDLGIDEFIEFTGRVSWAEAMRLLSEADICVDPAAANRYHQNNTAVKVLEYMALGKPMVLNEMAGQRLTAGDAALYSRSGERREFARLLVQLMDHARQREELGRIGRERFMDRLSGEKMSEELIRAYQSLWRSPATTSVEQVGAP